MSLDDIFFVERCEIEDANSYVLQERGCRTDIVPKEIAVEDQEDGEVEYKEVYMYLYCDLR